VWTGKQMVILGGVSDATSEARVRCDAGAYDVATREWVAFAIPADLCRERYAAVWTGREILLWGHSAAEAASPAGASLNPTDWSWTPLPDAPLDAADRWSATWTGDEVIVFAYPDETERAEAAAYDPSTRAWRRLPESPVASVFGSDAIWTGAEVLTLSHWTDRIDGRAWPSGRYSPETDSWTFVTPAPPNGSTSTPVVWTGRVAIMTGLGEALAYHPPTDAWSALASPPMAVELATAVWTDTQVLVWGGSAGVDYPRQAQIFDLGEGTSR
jgi:hypothetical protein